MLGPISYVCERSAEYVLIPELVKKLREKYSSVTPIYPWMTREGSGLSKDLHSAHGFRVLGLYARRPKVLREQNGLIHMKINHELAVAAAAGRSLGIPMIAGCPLAKDLIELGDCNRFFWVDLAKVKPSDLGFDMVINNPLADETQDKKFVIDNLDEVLRIVEAESNLIGFDTFLESMKVIGMASRGGGAYHPLAFMGGYKAVYLLLTDVQRSGRF